MSQRSTESWIEQIDFIVGSLIQLSLLIIAFIAFVDQQWLIAFTAVIVFLLTFVPAFIERQLQVRLPVEISLFTCAFLFASFVLGEIGDFYERLWWWDIALHSSSAFVIGLIGFLTVYVFYMTNRIQIAPTAIAIVSFGSAVTVGTLWEIFEFFMDTSFGFNMQKSGLVDTMTDLIVNAGSALVAAGLGYAYVRYENGSVARKFIRSIVERHRASHSGNTADD